MAETHLVYLISQLLTISCYFLPFPPPNLRFCTFIIKCSLLDRAEYGSRSLFASFAVTLESVEAGKFALTVAADLGHNN